MSAFSKKLRAKRATLANEAKALLDKAETENRELTTEESASFDKIHGDIEEMRKQIDRAEKQEATELELSSSTGTRAGRQDSDGREPSDDEKRDRVQKENRAFTNFLRFGEQGLAAEDRQ